MQLSLDDTVYIWIWAAYYSLQWGKSRIRKSKLWSQFHEFCSDRQNFSFLMRKSTSQNLDSTKKSRSDNFYKSLSLSCMVFVASGEYLILAGCG